MEIKILRDRVWSSTGQHMEGEVVDASDADAELLIKRKFAKKATAKEVKTGEVTQTEDK